MPDHFHHAKEALVKRLQSGEFYVLFSADFEKHKQELLASGKVVQQSDGSYLRRCKDRSEKFTLKS
jgi:hypothetical protein